jgi:hypothetical protein
MGTWEADKGIYELICRYLSISCSLSHETLQLSWHAYRRRHFLQVKIIEQWCNNYAIHPTTCMYPVGPGRYIMITVNEHYSGIHQRSDKL